MVAKPSPAMEYKWTNLIIALTVVSVSSAKQRIGSYSVVLPVIGVSEEDVVQPKGWIDQR